MPDTSIHNGLTSVMEAAAGSLSGTKSIVYLMYTESAFGVRLWIM